MVINAHLKKVDIEINSTMRIKSGSVWLTKVQLLLLVLSNTAPLNILQKSLQQW